MLISRPSSPLILKDGAKVSPPQNSVLRSQLGSDRVLDHPIRAASVHIVAHFMVAQASFWYPGPRYQRDMSRASTGR